MMSFYYNKSRPGCFSFGLSYTRNFKSGVLSLSYLYGENSTFRHMTYRIVIEIWRSKTKEIQKMYVIDISDSQIGHVAYRAQLSFPKTKNIFLIW